MHSLRNLNNFTEYCKIEVMLPLSLPIIVSSDAHEN